MNDIDTITGDLIRSRNKTTSVVLESLAEIDKANLGMRAALDIAVSDSVADFRDRTRNEVVVLREAVMVKLLPAAGTSVKRNAATHRLFNALAAVASAFDEVNEALADVEDAV